MTEATTNTTRIEAFVGKGPEEVDLEKSAPFGWYAAIVIALVAFIDRVEISLVAGALPQIQEHFGFSDTVGGLIPTAAAFASVILLLPAGRLADRGHRKTTIALVVVAWSLCSIMTGLATTFALFFVVRMLLGAAAQLHNPPASSLLADYFPSRSRSKAFGIERAGFYTGLPAGVALGGVLAEAFGWRAVFFMVAAPGLLIALLVLTLREPIRGIGDKLDRMRGGAVEEGAAEGAIITGEAKTLFKEAVSLLEIRTLKGLVASQALLYLGLAGLFYWLTTYLERSFDIDADAAAGLTGGVGGTGIVVGIIIGSRIGDRTENVPPAHRIRTAWTFLLLGALALTMTVAAPALWLAVVGTALACVGFAGAIPNLAAASADVVPAARRGMGFALLQFMLSFAGASGPLIIGLVSDLSGTLRVGMAMLLPALVGTLILLPNAAKHYDEDAANALRG
ncbi:MFS transporter [Nocardioides sp.]|uniref:MFS transporter n=1 Tax=Nocardioides sp. TaxID=35761 RepID=UPI003567A5C1